MDIGCGDGALSHYVSVTLGNVPLLGIDPSPEMIKLAQERFPELRFQVADAENLPPGQVDLFTAFSCLHWVKGLVNAFKNIHAQLAAKGHFSALTFPAESKYWDMIVTTMHHSRWKERVHENISPYWLSSDAYLHALEKHFRLSYFAPRDRSIAYESRDALKDFVRGWIACMIAFENTEDMEFFLDDIAECAWRIYPTENGTCHAPYTQLEFIAQKM